MKPNKLYCAQLDDEFQKEREAKTSPWKYLNNNYIITKHFAERCNERKIWTKKIVDVLRLGKKYYYFENDALMTKHVYENTGIVEKEGKLMTAIFFGKREQVREQFTKCRDSFIFESE